MSPGPAKPKRVIVTAGAAGIGLAIVRRFLAAGARVAVCDIDQAQLDTLARIDPGVATARVDVADSAQVRDFVAFAHDRLGGLDALVNNAGIAGQVGPVEAIDDEGWTRCFAVNVHGAFYMTRAVVPRFKAQGAGAIVNISTGSTVTLPVDRSPYIASKWALEGLTRATARELGPSGIRVNAIRPGFVDSERMRGIMARIADGRAVPVETVEREFLQYISLRSKIQPEEIGDMAVFLVSDAARHVTGQLIAVDGNVEWE